MAHDYYATTVMESQWPPASRFCSAMWRPARCRSNMGVTMTIHNWTHFGQPDPMGVGAHCLQKITSHSVALTVLSLRTSGQPDPFRNQTMPRGSKTLVCVLKLFPHGLNVR